MSGLATWMDEYDVLEQEFDASTETDREPVRAWFYTSHDLDFAPDDDERYAKVLIALRLRWLRATEVERPAIDAELDRLVEVYTTACELNLIG